MRKKRNKKTKRKRLPARSCLPCTACCTCIGVEELDKAPGEPCPHLTDKGCGIYPDRPETCRNWKCLWLNQKADGKTDVLDRPDQLGIVIYPQNTQLGFAFCVFEVRPGAAREGLARNYIEAFAKRTAVFIMTNPRELLGPPEVLEKARDILAEVS